MNTSKKLDDLHLFYACVADIAQFVLVPVEVTVHLGKHCPVFFLECAPDNMQRIPQPLISEQTAGAEQGHHSVFLRYGKSVTGKKTLPSFSIERLDIYVNSLA